MSEVSGDVEVEDMVGFAGTDPDADVDSDVVPAINAGVHGGISVRHRVWHVSC